jgi:hypothetical protein
VCVAAVPLCSRHTHLEHIGERPASRGTQVPRRIDWRLGAAQANDGGQLIRRRARHRVEAMLATSADALKTSELADEWAHERFPQPTGRTLRDRTSASPTDRSHPA